MFVSNILSLFQFVYIMTLNTISYHLFINIPFLTNILSSSDGNLIGIFADLKDLIFLNPMTLTVS